MKVLVLGRSGLIGSAVYRALTASGFDVLVGGHGSDPPLDLSRLEDIESFPLQGVEAIVHVAGVTDEEVATSAERAIRRAGIAAPRLFQLGAAAGIKRYVYVSSSHVYGPFEGVKSESSPPNPLSTYAICHYLVEQAIRRTLINQDGAALLIRPNAVFGMPPNPSTFSRWTLIPFEFPQDLAKTGVIRIRSAGDQRRNFVATEDIGDGVAAWLSGPANEELTIWNPVGPFSASVYDFAKLCIKAYEELTGRQGRIGRGTEIASNADFELRSSWTLTRPSRRPEEYLERMLGWLLENPQGL